MDEIAARDDVEREAATRVWENARRAAGAPPATRRIARVREKLADPDCTLLTVAGASGVAGMLLAEPFRVANGSGEVVPGWGHISMVFVEPELQGRGLGSQLIRSLIAQRRWDNLSVWTRLTNEAGQRLYRKFGFESVHQHQATVSGELIERLERSTTGDPRAQGTDVT